MLVNIPGRMASYFLSVILIRSSSQDADVPQLDAFDVFFIAALVAHVSSRLMGFGRQKALIAEPADGLLGSQRRQGGAGNVDMVERLAERRPFGDDLVDRKDGGFGSFGVLLGRERFLLLFFLASVKL